MKQKLWIECQGKRILAEQAYKVVPKDDEVLDEIVLISENCHQKGTDNQHCKYCQGVCVAIKKEIFNANSGEFEIKTTVLRDKTVMNKVGEIKEVNKASRYIDSMNKIFSLESKEYSPSEAKTTIPWTAGDRPDTWASDCLKCKERCHAEGRLTECELATNYVAEQGIDLKRYSSDAINSIDIPDEFICRHQRQKIVLVY